MYKILKHIETNEFIMKVQCAENDLERFGVQFCMSSLSEGGFVLLNTLKMFHPLALRVLF